LFNFIWEDVGVGQKAKLEQNDKRIQYNKSNVHLPPCFLGEFPWKALLFLYFCLLLCDWHWKETDSFFSETQHFIFNSCFLPHQHGKSLIKYPSSLFGLLVITQFSSLVFSTQCCT
jgi:hypothetical protein